MIKTEKLKIHYHVFVRNVVPGLDVALVTFDQNGEFIGIGIDDPVFYSQSAKDYMLERGIVLKKREATNKDIEKVKKCMGIENK